MINYSSIKTHDSEYNPLRALLLIIKIRLCGEQSLRDKYKIELFMMMAKVIVKNVENFWFLAKPHKHSHHLIDTEELIAECWLAMEACIKNFGAVKTGNVRYDVFYTKPNGEYFYKYSIALDFYFYYNKSLTQRLNRVVKKNFNNQIYTVDDFRFIRGDEATEDEVEFINVNWLRKKGMGAEEITICILKMRGYTTMEIARKMRMKTQKISLFLNQIKSKI